MKKVLMTLAAAMAVLASFAPVAGAQRQGVTPNPATACKALVTIGVGGYSSFSSCVTSIWSDVAAFRFEGKTLDQNCAELESQFLTYPGFYLDEGPEWPFVQFTVNTHAQCMLALYTYHTLVGG